MLTMDANGPAVTCNSCARTWNSAGMAEGLRLIGSCPRCSGELAFRDAAADAADAATPARMLMAPHMVMGLPRL